MKINEIIRERRLAKGFTQEQIANYLGVSAPAVNKWEKGTSYPDIMNEVSETMDKNGFEAGYLLAAEKLKEYPACDLLIINS